MRESSLVKRGVGSMDGRVEVQGVEIPAQSDRGQRSRLGVAISRSCNASE